MMTAQSSVGDFRPDDAQNLVDFVHSEVGRAADASLEDTAPIVLYLATEKDRDEFVAAIHEVLPGMISRQWP
jgi:hypothetical protein